MFDEPRRHRFFMLAVVGVALFTAPFPFIGRELVLVWGLPMWLWWSFVLTAMLSALTAWGMLCFWRDDASVGDVASVVDEASVGDVASGGDEASGGDKASGRGSGIEGGS